MHEFILLVLVFPTAFQHTLFVQVRAPSFSRRGLFCFFHSPRLSSNWAVFTAFPSQH